MFNSTPCSSNVLSTTTSYTAVTEKPKCTNELSTILCNAPKSSNSLECTGSKPKTTVSAAGYGGPIVNVTIVNAAGYGGAITTIAPKQPCQSKEGMGGRIEIEDKGKRSQPMGGRENENEREDEKSPLKAIAGKCNEAKNFLVGLVTPATPATVVSAAGYGGPIAAPVVVAAAGYGGFMGSNTGSGFGTKCVEFNMGSSKKDDLGKSQPCVKEVERPSGKKC